MEAKVSQFKSVNQKGNYDMKLRMTTFALAAAAFAVSAVPASAQSRVEVGVLTCNVAPSIGYVIASRRDMRCTFVPNDGSRPHRYSATASRVGLDLGVTREGVLVWGVFAPTHRLSRKDLVGTYAGASAGAAVVIGVGANALFGGSNNTIALQPFSGEGSVGLSVALGVTALSLR
jgi:Protein of unknown function (DUF992)